MLEIIFAAAAFVGSLIYFNKKPLESKSVWKAMGLSILIILAAIVFFVLTNSRFMSIIIVPTIICSVYISTLYREMLTRIHKRQQQLLKQREG
ncbi:hypothetical protein MKY30_01630 [Oceanobacillus sp. FSL W8-0428]|uniref:Uncharacterized protein n=1 Tax=Oceanobacillus sojae TaxID=582851 RepID=A0A511ZI24_9BACI|nr:hypothetical protein [Oceanobacillus sojae]GEN87087.1 hypothetical protein OSO01_18260 [Oceanobacillus sojae]